MPNYQRITKAELVTALRNLEVQVASLESIAAERDRQSHELSHHQIELEAQNQELREAEFLVEESRDRFADLYDFAPMGYVALDGGAHIQEINLTGATMLGVERSRLIGMPFSLYVDRNDVGVFREHLRQCGLSLEPVTSEVQVLVKEAQTIRVQLVSMALHEDGGESSRYRITMTDVTAYRRAEQEARDSAVLLAKIFASLDHAVFVVDSSTHLVVNCNAAVETVFGCMPHEVIGKTTAELHADRDAHRTFLQRLSLALDAQGAYHCEVAMRRMSGSIFPAEITVTEIRSDAGERTGVVILVRDISERKRAEQAQSENEERFRTIFEQAAVGVTQCVSQTGEYVRANRKYCDIAGYACDELLTQKFHDITYPDDLNAELSLMQQLTEGKVRTFSMEKRLRRKDGTIVWVNLTVSSMWASGDKPTHYIAIIEDITERRQALEDTKLRLAELEPVSEISNALRAAQALDEILPTLLDLTLKTLSATVGSIWLYDWAEDVLRPAASRGRNDEDVLWYQPLKPGEGIVGAVFATGQPHLLGDCEPDQGTAEALRRQIPPGGGGAAMPIRAGDRVIGTFVINVPSPRKLTTSEVHLLTTLSDLAGTSVQRILIREEAERRAAELEQRVIQRTAELSQREAALEAANAQLKELDRMKGQFVSNVSHELRTPITTIKLYASLLRGGPPGQRDQFLAALEQEANWLAHLIEEILEVSRIDSGRLDLHYAPHVLNDLVQVALVRREPLAAEKCVALTCNLLTPSPTVLVDRVCTLQVMDNLVENALWYTSTSGQVCVATGSAEADGHTWATLSVTDTGMGIPKDELPRIFERFFRGEKPREMQLPGTGLGLAIVKDIVDQQGWRVTVESEVGIGSTFMVWLPLA